MDPQGHGMIGWVNLAYQSEDDELGLDFEDEYLSDDFFSDEELLSESEEGYLFEDSETDDGAEDHVSQPSVRLLLTGEGEVQQHGIHTSVPHHQCCDALSLADVDSDSLVFTEGKFAVLYDMGQHVLVSAVDLGFKPYSIARHEDMFAAVGTRDVKIFFLRPDPKKGNVITFQPTAEFQVGALRTGSNMNNGVRFGRCGMEWKLFVASQDCFLYVFNVPGAAASNTSKSGAGAPSSGGKRPAQVALKDFLSTSLKKQYCSALDRQPGIFRREPPMVRGPDGEELKTDLIGRFKVPLNCVAASPDGRLLAVVGDSSCVWVLDRASGYSTSNMASFSLDSRARRPTFRGYKGCQYVAWNSSSDLLAASSDTDCIVRVWRVKPPAARRRAATRNSPDNVATGEVVGTYNHNHPCLALQFSPVDPYLLFYTEVPTSSPGTSPSLHAVDLHGPPEAFQTIRISDFPSSCPAAQFSSGGCNGGHSTVLECIKGQCPGYRKWQKPTPDPRPNFARALPRMLYSTTGAGAHPQVTGLAVSRKHGVLLSLHGGGENGTRNQVLQFRPLEWSLERHRLFPEGFKETTRFILLAASSTLQVPPEEPGPSSAESSSFRSLPKDLVYSIIEKAATPQGAWVPRTSPPEGAEAGRDGPKRRQGRVPGAVVFQAGPY